MHLVNLTLQKTQAITCAIAGHFIPDENTDTSSPRVQEIIVARGKSLEQLQYRDDKQITIVYREVFSIIRDQKILRLPGFTYDYIIVGNDSGKFIILRYNTERNMLETIIEETYGKTGCRRIVPGQYIAVDPEGRAVMIGALEKMKFVYSLTRVESTRIQQNQSSSSSTTQARLHNDILPNIEQDLNIQRIGNSITNTTDDNTIQIKSPVEAHKAHTVVYSMCGVHVSNQLNPTFACLEAEYEENSTSTIDENDNRTILKNLIFYELDLGVNSVARVLSQPVDPNSNIIFTVPYDLQLQSPGGVLVCAENFIYLHTYTGDPNYDLHSSTNNNDTNNNNIIILRVPIPRRFELESDQSILITSITMGIQRKKRKGEIFFLLQSEFGDIYRLQIISILEELKDGTMIIVPKSLKLSYFDTVPPCTTMIILQTNMSTIEAPEHLFLSTETGNCLFLRINPQPILNTIAISIDNNNLVDNDDIFQYFEPKHGINLEIAYESGEQYPIMNLQQKNRIDESTVDNNMNKKDTIPCTDDSNNNNKLEIIVAGGKGIQSRLRILQQGQPVQELVRSELPGNPSNIFAIKENLESDEHSLLILTFPDSTIILRAGDEMEEVNDTGLQNDVETLHIALQHDSLGFDTRSTTDGIIVQIHSQGIRMVRTSTTRTIGTPQISDWRAPNTIVCCQTNEYQIVVSVSGGDIYLLEPDNGEIRDIAKITLRDATALALAPILEGQLRASFILHGDYSNTLRVISYDIRTKKLQVVASKVTSSFISSFALVNYTDTITNTLRNDDTNQYILYLGQSNGILEIQHINKITGILSDPQSRVVGTLPVHLVVGKVEEEQKIAVFTLSSCTWILYNHGGTIKETLLNYDTLAAATQFSCSLDPYGFMVVSNSSLRLISLSRLGSTFSHIDYRLRYTPKFVQQHTDTIYVSQSDTQTQSNQEMKKINIHALITIESDCRTYPYSKQLEIRQSQKNAMNEDDEDSGTIGTMVDGSDSIQDDNSKDENTKQDNQDDTIEEQNTGTFVTDASIWGCCIRILDHNTQETIYLKELEDNETITSAAIVRFKDKQLYLVVGIVRDFIQLPVRKFTSCCIRQYRFIYNQVEETIKEINDDDEEIETINIKQNIEQQFIHNTVTDNIVGSQYGIRVPTVDINTISSKNNPNDTVYNNDLSSSSSSYDNCMQLAGVGASLKLYEQGHRRQLIKTENKNFTSLIRNIQGSSDGTRIYFCDSKDGIFYANIINNKGFYTIHTIATSTLPRMVTTFLPIDHDTVVGGDKFGNIFISRLSLESISMILNDPTGGYTIDKYGILKHEKPHHQDDIVCFYVGEMVTDIIKTKLIPNGTEVLLYSTIYGTLGILVPLITQADADFFTHLEMYLRRDVPSLLGRDHLMFRSYYQPVRNMIDGDLLSLYTYAHAGIQSVGLTRQNLNEIAESLASTPKEVARKINEIMRRVM